MAESGHEAKSSVNGSWESPRFWTVLFLLGIGLGLLVRWSFPAADPPLHRQTGAILYDEVWGFAARNAVLWGAWQQDEWRPWVVCPVHTHLLEASFRIFGMTPFGLRFPAMLSGTLILAYVYLMLRAARFSNLAGLAAAFVLATSWTMTGFSKCMTLEPTLNHCFALAFLCIIVAEGRTRGALMLYGAAGVFAGLASLCKTSGVPMALSVAPYLALGAVARGDAEVWRWRAMRTATYLVGFVVIVALGFWHWMLPNVESFYQLTIQTSFLQRAQNPILMRAYKAIFWLDSQAFLTTPFWLCALLLLLPTLRSVRRGESGSDANMQRFAVGLSLAMAVVGLGLMINVDVPARRLVYLSIPLAVLTGALWDAASRSSAYGENPRMYEIDSRLARVGAIAGCAIAGLIVVGWVVSPNGGLSSFVVPRFSAWLLFDMRAKIAYKLLWLGAGLVAGLLLWRVRARVWANRRSLLACALIAHGAYYVAVSGLWVSRLSYTGLNASKTVGELVPPGSYMLGADAAAQGYFNQTRPLFWSPKVYRFANYDEEAIQRDYNPEFMLLNAVDVARLRDGTFACSPYIASFLEHEVARMPLYEYHESLTLDTELVLFRRAEH